MTRWRQTKKKKWEQVVSVFNLVKGSIIRKCSRCQKSGHRRDNCPAPVPRYSGESSRQRTKSNTIQATTTETDSVTASQIESQNASQTYYMFPTYASNNFKTRNADKEEIKPVKRVLEVVAGGEQRQRERSGRRSSEERSDNEREKQRHREKWSPGVGGTQRHGVATTEMELVAFASEWSWSPYRVGVEVELVAVSRRIAGVATPEMVAGLFKPQRENGDERGLGFWGFINVGPGRN
ncbi:hypothetical protein LXL04_011092 [Taraxacum kok-saghyz]